MAWESFISEFLCFLPQGQENCTAVFKTYFRASLLKGMNSSKQLKKCANYVFNDWMLLLVCRTFSVTRSDSPGKESLFGLCKKDVCVMNSLMCHIPTKADGLVVALQNSSLVPGV